MYVYWIRHGQSICNLTRRRGGWSLTPLSEEGHRQAAAAGEYLQAVPFDRIYSSDLPRCVQTAQDALPGCQPILDPRLREIHVGELTDLLAEECLERWGESYRQYMRDRDFTPYGGENMEQHQQRVFDFIRNELETLEGAEHVAVFSHEGSIHKMLRYALECDCPIQSAPSANASAAVFALRDGKWQLVQWNYTGGLVV